MTHRKLMNKERLVFFSDAILAIIVTILVLDIKVPLLDNPSDAELTRHLLPEAPHLVAFALSFAVIIVLWFSHNELMDMLHQVTAPFGALNFLFLGATATIPFTTALVGEYPQSTVSVAMLAGNMLLMNTFLAALFAYSAGKGLRGPDSRPTQYERKKRALGIVGGLLFLSSIFVAFLSPTVSLIVIAAVPVMHCLPLKMD